jgi:hypothetical protein
MSMIAQLPSGTGTLGAVKHSRADVERAREIRLQTLRRELVRDDTIGHFRPRRESLLYVNKKWDDTPLQQRALAWLRDHVHSGIPRAYYHVLLGHDIHLTASAELFVVHHHATEPDPFTGSIGWTENVGRVSQGKVTNAFRDFMSLMLVTDATTMGDYKYHEVGTDATAEANTQTALITTTSIARVAGNQTNPTAPTYQSVATITADSSETWQEHGLFNASTSVTLMDRSLISPTVAVVNLDTVTFTYVLTLNSEA